MENRVTALESAVEALARSGERTNFQLDELIRLGERQIAQKEALERAFKQIGHSEARNEEHRLRIQALEDARHRAEEDQRIRNREADDAERRISALELKMPGLEQVRSWVILGVLAIVGAAAALVWASVTERPSAGPTAAESAPSGLVEPARIR